MSARRLLTADLVQPFNCWSGSLLRPRLTSAAPSRPLTVSVAQWQDGRPPRVRRATFTLMPAAFTSATSVQVPGFEDRCLLTRDDRLICDFCSSGQCFAFGFLQIPPRGGHPCRSASGSPCRAHRGLTPPSRPGRPPRRAGTARPAERLATATSTAPARPRACTTARAAPPAPRTTARRPTTAHPAP